MADAFTTEGFFLRIRLVHFRDQNAENFPKQIGFSYGFQQQMILSMFQETLSWAVFSILFPRKGMVEN